MRSPPSSALAARRCSTWAPAARPRSTTPTTRARWPSGCRAARRRAASSAAPAARGQDRRHRARARTRTSEGSPQMSSALERTDPEVFASLQRETERQEYNLELIASENVVSEAVLEAQGSILTNKYAEGYPGRRYYGGCQFVDEVETLAIARAKALFGAEAANVQPHSGSQANMCVYFSQLEMGATILSMNLAHGGHLTHGSPVNFSGKYFRVVPYGVRESDSRIDLVQS